VSDEIPTRETCLTALRERLHGFQGASSHLIPDLVLYHLGLDVLEQAEAAELLAASNVPRAGYTNARSALEAAIDMQLLVVDPARYDIRGAEARAAELMEADAFHKRRERADDAYGLTALPSHPRPEDVALEDADSWDRLVPGRGRIMRQAFEAVQARWKQHRHWSGIERMEILRIVGAAHNDVGGHLALDAIYGALSIQVHPRPRTGQREVSINGAGDRLIFSARDLDKDLPLQAVHIACVFALGALERRAVIPGAV
jgi:hypothetical protein